MEKKIITDCKEILKSDSDKIMIESVDEAIEILGLGDIVWSELTDGIMFFQKKEKLEIFVVNFEEDAIQKYADEFEKAKKVLNNFFTLGQEYFYVPNKELKIRYIN